MLFSELFEYLRTFKNQKSEPTAAANVFFSYFPSSLKPITSVLHTERKTSASFFKYRKCNALLCDCITDQCNKQMHLFQKMSETCGVVLQCLSSTWQL